jgi:hypothetical protein
LDGRFGSLVLSDAGFNSVLFGEGLRTGIALEILEFQMHL